MQLGCNREKLHLHSGYMAQNTKAFILAEIEKAGLSVDSVMSDIGITEIVVKDAQGRKAGRFSFKDEEVLTDESKTRYINKISGLRR